MATPRRDIIDPSKPGTCHCVSRCVRRLLLLARPDDPDPDRWRRLLAERLVELVSLFAIDVLARRTGHTSALPHDEVL